MNLKFTFTALLFITIAFAKAQTKPEILSNKNIIELVKVGLSDDVIVRKINASSCNFDLSTNGLVSLKTGKVSAPVMQAMMDKADGKTPNSAITNNPSTTSKATTKGDSKKTTTPTDNLLASTVTEATKIEPTKKSDCKYAKGKDEKGQPIEMVAAPARIGTFYLWKKGNIYLLSYTTKALFIFASDENNTTTLGISSVDFYFEGNKFTLPAIGQGKIKNEIKLKNTFEYLQFQVEIPSNMLAKFSLIKLADIMVHGEKEAGWHDNLTEKQQTKFMQAFGCL